MRCFFLRAGHIAAVEMLRDLSDQEAIAKAHKLFFLERRGQFEGFETGIAPAWSSDILILRRRAEASASRRMTSL